MQKKIGYDSFSTTLLVSPYQNHEAIKEIGEEFAKQFGIRDVMFLLARFKISTEDSLKVYKVLGNSAVSKIEENPYILCSEKIDFPFEKAEDIAGYFKMPSSHK